MGNDRTRTRTRFHSPSNRIEAGTSTARESHSRIVVVTKDHRSSSSRSSRVSKTISPDKPSRQLSSLTRIVLLHATKSKSRDTLNLDKKHEQPNHLSSPSNGEPEGIEETQNEGAGDRIEQNPIQATSASQESEDNHSDLEKTAAIALTELSQQCAFEYNMSRVFTQMCEDDDSLAITNEASSTVVEPSVVPSTPCQSESPAKSHAERIALLNRSALAHERVYEQHIRSPYPYEDESDATVSE